MTAPAPSLDAIVGAPATVIVPGLLSGLGITRRPVPAWITDPDVIESIALGLMDIDDGDAT